MNWPIIEVRPGNLFLDELNIRLDSDSELSQSAIIIDLFENEEAYSIAESISQYGFFQDEFPIVIKKDESNFIVIEGNRRVAAVKALLMPDLVPTFKNKLSKISKHGIESMTVVVAQSRLEVEQLLAAKHTLPLRRPWKPLRQAFFYKSQIDNGKTIDELIRLYPHVDVTKFMRYLEMYHIVKSQPIEDPKILKIVQNQRKFPITVLERLYNDKNFAEFFGISFSEKGIVSVSKEIKSFNKAFSKVVIDIANSDIDTRSLNDEKQRKSYVDSLKDSFTLKDNPESFSKEKFKLKATTRVSANSNKPKLHNRNFKTNISSTSLRLLYDELMWINIRDYPNAAHELLRTLLECSLIDYFKSNGEFSVIEKRSSGGKHNPTLTEMLTHIENAKSAFITDKETIDVVRQIKQEYQSSYSVVRMQMIKHNEQWVSSESDVRAAWARLEKLFSILLNR